MRLSLSFLTDNTPSPGKVGHTTRVYVPYSFRIVSGFFNISHNLYVQRLWDRPNGLSSLSEKIRKSKHLQMSLQRQHFLLSYLKTLSVSPAGINAYTISTLTLWKDQQTTLAYLWTLNKPSKAKNMIPKQRVRNCEPTPVK